MRAPVIHLLHLTDGMLRWACLESGRSRAKLKDTGVFRGSMPEVLDRWALVKFMRGDRVILYDGRPMYYRLSLRLPSKARAQGEEAVRLRIRQELGMDAESFVWSLRTEAAPGERGKLDFFATVGRREGFEDLRQWKQSFNVEDLWVGSDLDGIEALARCGMLARPGVVVNADADGATLYCLGRDGSATRDRPKSGGADSTLDLSVPGGDPAAWRVEFGPAGDGARVAGIPALSDLKPLPRPDAGSKAIASGLLEQAGPALAEFDAVLLGGAIDHLTLSAPESFFREPGSSRAAGRGAPIRLELRWLVPVTALALVMFGFSFLQLQRMKERDRLDLLKKAGALSAETRRLRSQEGVLKRIKAARAPVTPIFEELMDSAPEGMTLQSLSVGETGLLQMNGIAQREAAPAAYANALGKSGLFDRVDLPEVRSDADGRAFSFQMTARIKGRGKK